MKTKIILTVALAGCILLGTYAFTYRESKTIAPGNGFAVIELFTSEGCSSCPPADALVAKIIKEDKDKPVYVLGYHVDYWNHLGWKDEFSKAEFSQRQRTYAGQLKAEVYTPQIVVNGKREFVGSEESTLRSAIQTALQSNNNEPLTLSNVSFTNDALNLQYQTQNTANRALLIAFVQKNAQTNVKAGENNGHVLSHVNIVRSLSTFALHQQSGSQTVKLPVGFNPQTWQVISFVQNTTTGQIVWAQKVTGQGV
jgi:hypothetical protein